VAALLAGGCERGPGAPSGFTLNGKIITAGSSPAPIPAATVAIVDGPDAGKFATTDGSGKYSLVGLGQATFTINVSAEAYVTGVSRVTVPATGFILTALRFTALQVDVFDTVVIGDVFRKVPGATVTLLDGPQGGMSAITDDSGTVRIPGDFGDPVKVSVTKDGYYPIQGTAQIQPLDLRAARAESTSSSRPSS
jgi:hypothetical protein